MRPAVVTADLSPAPDAGDLLLGFALASDSIGGSELGWTLFWASLVTLIVSAIWYWFAYQGTNRNCIIFLFFLVLHPLLMIG